MITSILIVLFLVAVGVVFGIWYFADVLMSPSLSEGAAASAGAKLQDLIVQEVAKSALQLAIIVVLGGMVKVLMDGYAEKRRQEAASSDLRKDAIRRLREIEGRVGQARTLLLAKETIDSYAKGMQELSEASQDLHYVADVVHYSKKAFNGKADSIIGALKRAASQLDGITAEWSEIAERINNVARLQDYSDVLNKLEEASPKASQFLVSMETFLENHRRALGNIIYIERK